MSKDIVWASNAMINPAMLRPIRHSFADSGEENKQKMLAAAWGIKEGKQLSSSDFPSEVYVAKDANTNYDKLDHLFYAYGYWVVSGAVADVMRRFDLGGGGLYPTKVFRKDRKTPIGEEWYCLNFGNVKEVYLSGGGDPTPHLKLPYIRHNAPDPLKDNQVTVSRGALAGPDIWVDPQIRDTFFLSDGLARALQEAGVAKPFGLRKCRVI